MQHFVRFLLVLAVVALVVPATTQAHFKLVEPASWIVENERGDPQKAGPCGGSNEDWGTPSDIVTELVGGSMMPLKIQETIYHPGHHLPPGPLPRGAGGRHAARAAARPGVDDAAQPPRRMGPAVVGVSQRVIEAPAQAPVLADGLFMHYTREPTPIEFEAEIPVPNINCERCTVQIIQWMAEHAYNNPGAYSYHHCAHVKITADPSKPIDEGWPGQE